MALQRTFGKISQRQKHGKVNCVIITAINTDNSFLCAKVWHIRENCRYFYSHSAVKVQQPMLGRVRGGMQLARRPKIATSSSASYSGWLNSFPLAYRCCFLRVWSIIEEVNPRLSRNKQTPASRERMKSFFLLLLDSIVLF